MARNLKTYTTSAGFFDLAVAAPSMKAALEAWGSTRNLFHQGFARMSEDPEVVAATMAKPGVVLRRPVGTDAAFSEHPALPKQLALGKARRSPAPHATQPAKPPTKPAAEQKARQASLAFDREQKRRQREALKEQAAQERERERRDRAIAEAEAALEEAKADHEAEVAELEKARAALDQKLETAETRWQKKRQDLEQALRKARAPTHLRPV